MDQGRTHYSALLLSVTYIEGRRDVCDVTFLEATVCVLELCKTLPKVPRWETSQPTGRLTQPGCWLQAAG